MLARHADLDLQRFCILRTIEHGVDSPKQMSAVLGIIPTQLSRSLDQLASHGLIERHLDPHDSRRTRLTITATGQDVTRQASHALQQAVADQLQALGPDRLSHALTAIDLLAELEFLENA